MNGFTRPLGVPAIRPDVLAVVEEGVRADLAGQVRDCRSCGSPFTGPGVLCPVCTSERNKGRGVADLPPFDTAPPISQAAARGLLEVLREAVELMPLGTAKRASWLGRASSAILDAERGGA